MLTIATVLSTYDRVLIFVGHPVVVREGFSHPVAGADKGCFCVNILHRDRLDVAKV